MAIPALVLLGIAFGMSDAPAKKLLILHGSFLEGCSCEKSCSFETTGALPGCHGVGVYVISKGTYGGGDISNVKFGFVTAPGDQLYIYIDAKDPARRKTAESLAKVLFAEGFGKLQAVRSAPISVTGTKGKYHFVVDGGKVLAMDTVPVFGGDGKTFVRLDNVFGDPYDSLYQAKTVSAKFSERGHEFELKNSSAFFLEKLDVRKKV